MSASTAVLGATQGTITLSVDTTGGLKTARIVEGVPRPKAVLEVPAVYPFNLPALAEGGVTIKMTIGKDGVVTDANIVTHAISFDASALASARQSRFEPVLINGAPAEVVISRTVTFPKNRGAITVSDRPPAIEVASPLLTKQVEPSAPASPMSSGLRGRILVEVVIGTSGKVKAAQILHGVSPQLDQAALSAVRQWVYEQTTINGMAMEVVTVVAMNISS